MAIMIENDASYPSYAAGDEWAAQRGRLPLGSALLAVFGLSLLAWAVILLPLAEFFYG